MEVSNLESYIYDSSVGTLLKPFHFTALFHKINPWYASRISLLTFSDIFDICLKYLASLAFCLETVVSHLAYGSACDFEHFFACRMWSISDKFHYFFLINNSLVIRLPWTDDTWFSYFLPRDWDILIMDALLHIPGNDEKHQTLRINISDKSPPCTACTATSCIPCASENSETKMSAKHY